MSHNGYLTGLGMFVVFLAIFLPAQSGIYHGIFHYVNGEHHKWCLWCQLGRLLNYIDNLPPHRGEEEVNNV